jgi:hypothetical protein
MNVKMDFRIIAAGTQQAARARMSDSAPSGQHTQFVQVAVKVGGNPENPKLTCPSQFILAVAAA